MSTVNTHRTTPHTYTSRAAVTNSLMSSLALNIVLCETVRRNRFKIGIVYLQTSRGETRRDHPFSGDDGQQALVVTVRRTPQMPTCVIEEGIAVAPQPDIRWDRCDIKSIALLTNAIIKQAAREQGAYEARQIDHVVFVTEGGSANAWIINAEGQFVTRQAEKSALNGITRRRLIELAKAQEIKVQERPFTLDEIKLAGEAF